MQLEEQLRQRLDAARQSIRAKYKALGTITGPNDPIRSYLADEIERESSKVYAVRYHTTRLSKFKRESTQYEQVLVRCFLPLSIPATQTCSQNFRTNTISCNGC
jgi:hypothetical protein